MRNSWTDDSPPHNSPPILRLKPENLLTIRIYDEYQFTIATKYNAILIPNLTSKWEVNVLHVTMCDKGTYDSDTSGTRPRIWA